MTAIGCLDELVTKADRRDRAAARRSTLTAA
jgi:hypothetical protein